MSDKQSRDERVSCLMDNESSDPVEWICSDGQATACWSRFHIIGDVIRGDHHHHYLTSGFSDRVMQSLQDEPTIINPRALSRRRSRIGQQLLKPVAGLAIAASVAAVTVISYQSMYQADGPQMMAQTRPAGQNFDQVAISQQMIVPAATTSAAANDQTEPADDSLDSYLLEHMEQAGGVAQGVMPYARLAGYDGR